MYSRQIRGFRNINANRTSRIAVVDSGEEVGHILEVFDDYGGVKSVF